MKDCQIYMRSNVINEYCGKNIFCVSMNATRSQARELVSTGTMSYLPYMAVVVALWTVVLYLPYTRYGCGMVDCGVAVLTVHSLWLWHCGLCCCCTYHTLTVVVAWWTVLLLYLPYTGCGCGMVDCVVAVLTIHWLWLWHGGLCCCCTYHTLAMVVAWWTVLLLYLPYTGCGCGTVDCGVAVLTIQWLWLWHGGLCCCCTYRTLAVVVAWWTVVLLYLPYTRYGCGMVDCGCGMVDCGVAVLTVHWLWLWHGGLCCCCTYRTLAVVGAWWTVVLLYLPYTGCGCGMVDCGVAVLTIHWLRLWHGGLWCCCTYRTLAAVVAWWTVVLLYLPYTGCGCGTVDCGVAVLTIQWLWLWHGGLCCCCTYRTLAVVVAWWTVVLLYLPYTRYGCGMVDCGCGMVDCGVAVLTVHWLWLWHGGLCCCCTYRTLAVVGAWWTVVLLYLPYTGCGCGMVDCGVAVLTIHWLRLWHGGLWCCCTYRTLAAVVAWWTVVLLYLPYTGCGCGMVDCGVVVLTVHWLWLWHGGLWCCCTYRTLAAVVAWWTVVLLYLPYTGCGCGMVDCGVAVLTVHWLRLWHGGLWCCCTYRTLAAVVAWWTVVFLYLPYTDCGCGMVDCGVAVLTVHWLWLWHGGLWCCRTYRTLAVVVVWWTLLFLYLPYTDCGCGMVDCGVAVLTVY